MDRDLPLTETHTPCTVKSGRYAFYWNAFLLFHVFEFFSQCTKLALFCTSSNGNKLVFVTSYITFDANLHGILNQNICD